jgi:hypothetical protein
MQPHRPCGQYVVIMTRQGVVSAIQTVVVLRYIMVQLNLCCCFGALGYGVMDRLERLYRTAQKGL